MKRPSAVRIPGFPNRLLQVIPLLFLFGTLPGNQLRVVATIPDLASIAAAVGGEEVTVFSICQGNEDPHFLQARPTYIVRARDADLWIRAGMDLEVGWEPLVVEQSRNRSILPGQPGFLDGSDYIEVVLEVPAGHVSRAMGDVHPSGNPHYLLDPLNARAVAGAIGTRLGELRPERADYFAQRAQEFVQEVDRRMFGPEAAAATDGDDLWSALLSNSLDDRLAELGASPGGWYARTEGMRGKRIVTFHKSFTYFANRFGIRIEIELEPVPGVPPSPAHLARVVDTMVSQSIGLILMEPFYPRRPADFVADRTGARVAVVSTYAQATDPDAWFRMIDSIVEGISGR